MASCQADYKFLPGRKARNEDTGPGILIIDNAHRFRLNSRNKDKTVYTYYCFEASNPTYKCRAKATVVKKEDGNSFLYSYSMIGHLL